MGLEPDEATCAPATTAQVLDVPPATRGRACIIQLGKGLPKLDLTEFSSSGAQRPTQSLDFGIARTCLVSEVVQTDDRQLEAQGVEFLWPPSECMERLAEGAICKHPDGTLIEFIQVHLDRWPPTPTRPKGQTTALEICASLPFP